MPLVYHNCMKVKYIFKVPPKWTDFKRVFYFILTEILCEVRRVLKRTVFTKKTEKKNRSVTETSQNIDTPNQHFTVLTKIL